MKLKVSLLLLLLASAPLLAAPASPASKDKLAIATEGVAPPFNFFQGKQMTGFEVEVADEIARRLGKEPRWVTQRFESLLIGLSAGRYDLVAASHTITEERAKAVDFTLPHYCTGAVIMTRDGSVKKKEDLKGKTVSLTVGTTYMTYAKQMPWIKEARSYPNQNDGLQALLMSKVDAWMIDKFVALDVLKSPQGKGLVMSELLVPERCALAVKKGNKALLEGVNAKLAEMLADGAYEKISKKYFGEDIRCP
jgi:polar amino acid transport system substrate-binding protein